jgi:hypothetical protein
MNFFHLVLYHCITFSFFVQIEQFKLLWNHHLKIYKSCYNFKGNKIIFKEFFKGSKINYEVFYWEFHVKMSPPTLGGRNFFTYNPFLSIFSVTNVPKEGFHLFFGHHKQWGLRIKMASKPYLKCSDTNWSTLPLYFLIIKVLFN